MKIPSTFTRFIALSSLLVAGSLAFAQQAPNTDPPARVATLSAMEGSVVLAPAGETEWSDATRNRPITRGDRLWTDEGARAEVHFGASALQMNARSFVEVMTQDDDALQLSVNEGAVDARVRELQAGENFEVDTPNLAFRAMQPGDWRIDVDPQRGFTRITARSGTAVVYGAGGGVQQIAAGQTMAFAGHDLAQLASLPTIADDGFDRWAADRNRTEDQSVAARHVPREVVGYQELDRSGTWSQDPSYGTVWYPQVAAADWAPYRYGHWDWIEPWGWTWIDDAAWGFAPFHYGRWTMIGTRWAWVPGPLGRHPVYAPALVAFVGGGNDFNFSVASGPGIAWYPLAPGEIWRPFFNASPAYVRNVNRYLVSDSRFYNTGTPYFMRRAEAITAVRMDDFHRGRPVQSRWSHVNPYDVARAQSVTPPAPVREARRAERDRPRETVRAPQMQAPAQRFAQPIAPAQQMRPSQGFYQPREEQRREFAPRAQPQFQPQPQFQQRPPQNWRPGEEGGYQSSRGQREQQRQAFVQQQRQVQPQQQARVQREERRVQRQAQREEDGRGHGRRYE